MENAKVAIICDYVGAMTERLILEPLRRSVCAFDVVGIANNLDQYVIWISPIKLGMGQFMYEITLKGSTFKGVQVQSFLNSIAAPLSLDQANKFRKVLGDYSIVISTTNENDAELPNIDSVLKLVAALL